MYLVRVPVCVCVWYLIKDPDLSVDGGPWHPMTVVVEEDSLLFGVASQRRAQLLHLVHRGVQTLLVTSLRNSKEERKMSALLCYIYSSRFWHYIDAWTRVGTASYHPNFVFQYHNNICLFFLGSKGVTDACMADAVQYIYIHTTYQPANTLRCYEKRRPSITPSFIMVNDVIPAGIGGVNECNTQQTILWGKRNACKDTLRCRRPRRWSRCWFAWCISLHCVSHRAVY